jgi:hypothetical protein
MKNILGIILIGLATNIRAQSEQANTSGGMVSTVSSVSNGPEIGLYQLAFGKVTIDGKEVDTAIQWNSKTGEARMLNAASFSDKSTGQKGNLVGWVPVTDLQQAVKNLAKDIKDKQQSSQSQ